MQLNRRKYDPVEGKNLWLTLFKFYSDDEKDEGEEKKKLPCIDFEYMDKETMFMPLALQR